MEIPYTVTARKDTGLFNAKVGIWLFLASEVMLFGGLFSGYVFLRIYADYPWPERALPIVPGLINTFVLIGSSVTVVFAWASLKMRQWRRFQVFMAITIGCAAVFMVLKAIEYKAKWEHQAVRMDDFAIIEGHAHYATILSDGKVEHFHTKKEAKKAGEKDAEVANKSAAGAKEKDEESGGPGKADIWKAGKPFKANTVLFQPETIDFSVVRAHEPWIANMLEQASKRKSKLVTSEDVFLYGHIEDYAGTESEPISGKDRAKQEADVVKEYGKAEENLAHKYKKNSLYIPAGTPLGYELIKKARKVFIAGRAHNAATRTAILKENWKRVKKAFPEDNYWEQTPEAKIDAATQLDEQVDEAGKCIAGSKVVSLVSTLSFKMDPPQPLIIKRSWIKRPVKGKDGKAELRDDTSLNAGEGEGGAPGLLESPVALSVDAIDFRWMAQKAEEAGNDPMEVIEQSWIFSKDNKNGSTYRKIWKVHKKRIGELEQRLIDKYGRDEEGKPKRVATETDRYRVTWQDFVHYARAEHDRLMPGDPGFDDLRPKFWNGFAGPNHKDEEIHELHAFPELEIPHHKVSLQSMFTPKWNTYYAIYFTLTGLHGLHVVGGALVLGYYLFFSKGLYRRNPEWLANRVEVGGLFWHFVDLVWIFLFPILYLM
ncbi:MAG: cytochrome c oxidase subunit 3 [Roseibacillus sp.]|nr:cytochrome c oxidase subunit 3 [Roseibacillus sp.]